MLALEVMDQTKLKFWEPITLYVTQTDKEKPQAERNNFKFELVQWKSKDEFKTATTTTTTTPTE